MTTTEHTSEQSDRIVAEGLAIAERMREQVRLIEKSRDEQPQRLAKVRSEAEEARGWSLIEEPFADQVKTIESVDGAAVLSMPNITARELWGARLAFDLLDCERDDLDHTEAVIGRLFTTVGGDPGVAMIVMSAALTTIASLVVPQLVDEIEQHASNYDVRVMLAEARTKSWNGRVAEMIRAMSDDLNEAGVNRVDGYDIGANALDPDTSTVLGDLKDDDDTERTL